MKIAYVTARFPYRGAELFFEPEIAMLRALGHEVLVVPTRPGNDGPRNGTGAYDVLRLGLFEARTVLGALSEGTQRRDRALRAFAQVAARRYNFGSKVKNLAVFPKAVALARCMSDARVDHIHAHWLSTPSTVAYVSSLLSGIPWSCTAHRFDLFEDNLIDVKAAAATFVRVVSERGREVLLEKVAPSAARRLYVGHIGVAVPPHPRTPLNGRVVQILCPANLVPVKGHRYLLDALCRLRDLGIRFECDLAGEGPNRGAIERELERTNLRAQIRLRGRVDHERLCAQLANGHYDIAVLPSTEQGTQFEGIPVALMEAMAAAVPCVATRTGSIPELIDDPECSRLVPDRDPEAMARAIAELALDPQLRARVAQRARDRILAEFDVRQTTEELVRRIRQA